MANQATEARQPSNDVRTANWWFQHNITKSSKPVPLHTHNYYEVYCFLHGDAIYHIEGSSYQLKPYDILLINSNESHYVEFLSDAVYDRMCFHFRKEFVEHIDKSGFLLAPFEKRDLGISNLFRTTNMKESNCKFFIDLMAADVSNREAHLSVTLFSLLNELARYFTFLPDTDKSVETQTGEIIRYINDHIGEELLLDSIAEHFYISKIQLLRIFKKELGTTVHNYITLKRLVAAQQMLSLGNRPSKIFQDCGFTNYSVFYRAYKKHFGCAPSEKPPANLQEKLEVPQRDE